MDVKIRLEEGLEKHVIDEGVFTNAVEKLKGLRDGAKNERDETKAMFNLIYQYAKGKKLNPEEVKFIKGQGLDLVKIAGLAGFSMLPVPGTGAVIPLLQKGLKKINPKFNIYPTKHDIPNE